jgi:hypothetical protein
VTKLAECPAVACYGSHLDVVVFTHPLRRFFRKTYVLRCWRCDLRIMEP